ncbi:MAG: hypothetical protein IPP69_06275 [Flavobacteriales bacterium]|nr:hypothetical protein [Flavobacteriales bacterium]
MEQKELTPEECLDKMLEYFKIQYLPSERIKDVGDYATLKSLVEFGHSESENSVRWRIYIRKLIDDGMMIRLDDKGNYEITFKGYFFNGYVAEAEQIRINSDREEVENEILINNARTVSDWTPRASKFALLAAIAGFLLFVMELVKYFFPQSSGNGEIVIRQIGIFL